MIAIKSTLNKIKKLQKQLDINKIGDEPAYAVIKPNQDGNGYKWQIIESYHNKDSKTLYANDYDTEYLKTNNYKKTTMILFDL